MEYIEIFQEFFRSKNRTSANFLGEVFRTETELKIRNEIERKMQDNQPNVEKEKWLSVWGLELTSSEAHIWNIVLTSYKYTDILLKLTGLVWVENRKLFWKVLQKKNKS
jgi:uncharacterized protein Veg